MKERIKLLIGFYLSLLLVFILQKPLFMAYYYSIMGEISSMDWLRVMWHGLRLDLSTAAYLTVIPGLIFTASLWMKKKNTIRSLKYYFATVSVLLSLIFITDMSLYEHWGFRLDTTPLFYFLSSPKDALASASIGMIVGGLIALGTYSYILIKAFFYVVNNYKDEKVSKKSLTAVGIFILTASLFLPIRGGLSQSTMNTGSAYFSLNQKLNHAAVNPAFSLLESAFKESNFNKQYRYLPEEEANKIFQRMIDPEVKGDKNKTDSISLFKTKRPNIYMLILESFSSRLMSTLTAREGEAVAVNLDKLSRESIFFTNFYANSFRTDRGTVSILSGYPAQTKTSIMKLPRKSQHLPSIASSLRRNGYKTKYYYGGDANFTNMRSYVKGTGFETLISDEDFTRAESSTHWGVPDHTLFERAAKEINADSNRQPEFIVIQSLSSHPPFDVPFHKMDNKELNAFAYTDSVVGKFIEEMKTMEKWENSIVIIVPDHLGAYPKNVDNFDFYRYQIPMLILGGAVKTPMNVDTFASQQDIAATLLAQLGIRHDDFRFSKDIFNSESPHFAFFTFPDIFGLVNKEGRIIYDNIQQKIIRFEGDNSQTLLREGKAYIQKLYDDLEAR